MVLVLRPLTKEARIVVWGKREPSLKGSLFSEEPRFAQHSPILKFNSIFLATEHHLMWYLGCRISSLSRLCPPLSIASDLAREHSSCPLYGGVPCVQKRSSLLPMEFASPNLGVLRLWNLFMTCWQWRLISLIVYTLARVHVRVALESLSSNLSLTGSDI